MSVYLLDSNNNQLLSSEEPDASESESVVLTRINSSSSMEVTSPLGLSFCALSQRDVPLSLVVTGKHQEKSAATVGEPTKKRRQIDDGPNASDACSLKILTLDEVAWHDTVDDCWIVVYDYVYDVTGFVNAHPGGEDVLLEYAGRDATLAFVGTGHSKSATRIMEKYLVGELPPSERIFRTSNGIKIANFA
ncbi:cytochrome B5-like protein [Copidosoma floridanum]|uniref:cytochrome B5-like protein n=1 Tax=Copidosoma floridanum TaxID=29053 RepID=UPI0006C998B9|nr:cytochrome B5-like protein [Copidosoma floridanum]